MKIKINIIIFIVFIIFFLLPTMVLGFEIDTDFYEPTAPQNYESATIIGNSFISIIQYVGIILAIIILIIIGIKYMMGSVDEKAEYKKTMLPYILGCCLLVCTPMLIKVLALSYHLNYGGSATELPSDISYENAETSLAYGLEAWNDYIRANESATTESLLEKWAELCVLTEVGDPNNEILYYVTIRDKLYEYLVNERRVSEAEFANYYL